MTKPIPPFDRIDSMNAMHREADKIRAKLNELEAEKRGMMHAIAIIDEMFADGQITTEAKE